MGKGGQLGASLLSGGWASNLCPLEKHESFGLADGRVMPVLWKWTLNVVYIAVLYEL